MSDPWAEFRARPASSGDDPWASFRVAQEPQIDFNRPDEAIRDDIAALPEGKRAQALKKWAETAIANEKGPEAALSTPHPARSIPIVGGLLDEATAGINAGLHALAPSLGRPYEEGLAFERARAAKARHDYPATSLATDLAVGATAPFPNSAATALGRVGETAAAGAAYGAGQGFAEGEGGLGNRLESAARGAALGGAVGGVLRGAGEIARPVSVAFANRGPTGAYAQMARDVGSVDQFADQIATGAATSNAANNRRVLDVLGEEMVRANGDVAAAQSAAIARLAQEQGIAPATARRQVRTASDVQADSPLMLGEYQAVAESDAVRRGVNGGTRAARNVNLDDIGRVQESPLQAGFDYLANNGSAPSSSVVRNAISRRQDGLGPEMANRMQGLDNAPRVGNRPATIEDVAQQVESARAMGHAEYQAAYRGPTNNNALMNWLPRLLQRYDQVAAGRSGEYAQAMRRAADQFYTELPTGQRLAMQTLQQMQDARGAVRGQMQGYARQGRDDLARVIRPLYDQITRLMEHANPTWGRANQRWADMRLQEVAQELGDAFAARSGPRFREQMDEFQRLAPEAQDVVRTHFIQQQLDKLANLGDTHSVSKLFSNDHSRGVIRQLFGDRAAVDFTRAVRDQRVAENTQRMTQNSATHRRGEAQRQRDVDTGLMAAVDNASVSGIRNWLLERMRQVWNERRNMPYAQIMTTPVSDTAQVSMHLTRMRQAAQRMRDLQNNNPAWPGASTAALAAALGRATAVQNEGGR